jgi:hypothetical protein
LPPAAALRRRCPSLPRTHNMGQQSTHLSTSPGGPALGRRGPGRGAGERRRPPTSQRCRTVQILPSNSVQINPIHKIIRLYITRQNATEAARKPSTTQGDAGRYNILNITPQLLLPHLPGSRPARREAVHHPGRRRKIEYIKVHYP